MWFHLLAFLVEAGFAKGPSFDSFYLFLWWLYRGHLSRKPWEVNRKNQVTKSTASTWAPLRELVTTSWPKKKRYRIGVECVRHETVGFVLLGFQVLQVCHMDFFAPMVSIDVGPWSYHWDPATLGNTKHHSGKNDEVMQHKFLEFRFTCTYCSNSSFEVSGNIYFEFFHLFIFL